MYQKQNILVHGSFFRAITSNQQQRNFLKFHPKVVCKKRQPARNMKNISFCRWKFFCFWFWQKIVIMYDNNILTKILHLFGAEVSDLMILMVGRKKVWKQFDSKNSFRIWGYFAKIANFDILSRRQRERRKKLFQVRKSLLNLLFILEPWLCSLKVPGRWRWDRTWSSLTLENQ